MMSYQILGLDICGDTLVGDEMRKGISGGQKRRVTIGEMIVGPTQTLFMDEISTGLDSSTTFQIVKCLQQFVHVMGATIGIALLQPTSETYELFDDIILLSEGQIVYNGPREHVLEFFENCGFSCPDRKGTAEFLQEVTSNKDQEQYWADRRQPYRYISAKEFALRFKRFHVGLDLESELLVPYDKTKNHEAALLFNRYPVAKMEIFKACFAKEWLLFKRNSFAYIFRTVQTIIIALITVSLYWRTKLHHRTQDDANVYMGALCLALAINMFNGFAELPLTLARLPVLFKQRQLLFYPMWASAISTFLLGIPISLLESGVWTGMTYYAIGFAPQASRFFRQFLLIFLVHQVSLSLFRLIAGICRTKTIAFSGAALTFLLIFTFGGFVITPGSIPKGWEWGYWCSPLGYAYHAISVNEMLAPRWKISTANTTNLGVSVLESKSINPRGYWYWLGSICLLGFSLLFNVLYTLTLAYLNPFGKPQAAISDETLEEMPVQHQGIEQEPKVRPSMFRQGSLAGSSSSSGGNNTIERHMRCMSNRSVGVEGIPNNESALEAAKGVDRKLGMILPFLPLAMSFEDVNYFIDMPREMKEQGVTEERLQLLQDVTGSFRPCVLTALMGLSGAGKTTLMDVLAGRKTGGYIEGDIRISGFPKMQETFARISSYCEQNDIHSPQVTVRESLIYSALLRLPKGIDENTKINFVDEIMELVELHNLRDALVGLPGVSGLSTGQRKQLTIAVELVANPSIIFMDEPTSGLDARAAAIVMRVLRNTVDTGRAVVCTIHQPSIDIFESFDELLLMKRGGHVIYAGPVGHNSHKIVEYFKSIPGVPEIKDKDNPATWMLEVISMASEHRLGIDFAEHYKNSCLYQWNKSLVKELSTPAPGARDLYFATQYSQSLFGQFKLCLWKQWRTYWRSPSYNSVRFFFTLLSALFLGMVFWKQSTKRDSNSDILQMIGAMYVSILFLGANNSLTVQPVVAIERIVFYRERATRMYSVLPYALAQIVVEIPYIFGQTILYTFIVYNMMSFEWTLIKFSWFFFMYFFTFLCFTYYGMMTFSISPNHQVASILAVAFFHLFNLFSGFFIPRPKIPKWWIWYYWFCPLAWSIDGLISSQYGDLIDPIHISGDGKKPLNQYVEDYFGYKHGFLGQIAAALVGFSVLFAFIFGYGLKVLNFQQR